MRPIRVAIGQISQESSSFAARLTDLALFRNSYLCEGDELFTLAGADCEPAGMLAVCQREGATVVPLLTTRSVSGGPLSDDCYQTLRTGLLDRLRAAGTVDGVLLSLHGSMLTESEDDPEGDLLESIRDIVGPATPVIGTLDLHAHVTARMVRHATALISYTHYPHDDVYTTGERAAELLFRILRDGVRPAMALAKVPILAPGCEGQTFGDAPMAHLTGRARELERAPGILSVSCFHVHPHLDVPEMGCSAVVITDGDLDLAERSARSLAEEFWSRRQALLPEVVTVAEAVARGRAIAGGPVLLIDTADCAGGGASGDSVALLRQLLALGVDEPTYLMVVDPEAAIACAAAGIGQEIELAIGHKLDPVWGEPLTVRGRVTLLCDGRFRYTGGLLGGTMGAMGLSAVLEIGAIRLLVMSAPTYDWADEQFRAVGLDPRQAKFIGVKNPMNYRFAYREVAKAAFVVDTPGPTSPDIVHLPYRRVSRPTFPLDAELVGARVTVARGGATSAG